MGSEGAEDDLLLTGYLDGELGAAAREALEQRLAADPALAARLAALDAARPSAEAFDLLIGAAPADRLGALLKAAEAGSARRSTGRVTWRPRFAVAAAVALLVIGGAAVGFGIARYALPPVQVAGEAPNWRAVVAEYLSLYTDETLAAIPDDPAQREAELAHAAARLSLGLDPQTVTVPGLTLKRTQILEFNGMPLAQIAYRSPEAGPVALCIIANGRPDAAPAFEERQGWNIVFWNEGGLGFMVIGRIPPETLQAMADEVRSRV